MMFKIFNQTRKWQVKKTNILSVVVASLILTSVLISSGMIQGTNAFTPIPQTANNDGKIFDTLSSDISSNIVILQQFLDLLLLSTMEIKYKLQYNNWMVTQHRKILWHLILEPLYTRMTNSVIEDYTEE
ncbi:MAG: hypothetical protein L0H53_14395 [Candidatus Nitrosocosmicus sp.]|nr:hypothetical protein [Candidatus Nitrosocosmicus sp.]MDN5868593.1 hypothetical protein [Candidatus Nitrosocosmicus sp.]